ncbi:unnamed protein product, partial [Ectocarpus fasciculatus]
MSRCPDAGAQRFSAGGNVTVYVVRANNLANKDVFPTTSVKSDPYVEFTVGNNVKKKTDYVRDNLSPKWNEYVNLGLLTSGTEMKVSIWDFDSGIEYADDLISSISMRVPFCSTFNASVVTEDCGKPFGCASDDSLWEMPSRKMCLEHFSIDMSSGAECTEDSGSCLELIVSIIPFQFEVELENPDVITTSPLLSAYGPIVPRALWTSQNLFGTAFIGTLIRYDMTFPASQTLRGALMMRVRFNDRYKGLASDEYFYGAVNFPAYIYICRFIDDNEKGVPSWILNEYSDSNTSITQLNVNIENDAFGCYYKHTTGTTKNRWGGVTNNYLTFRTNTITGHDSDDVLFYNYPYTILAVPKVIVDPEEKVEINYDSAGFVESFFQQGLICLWFIFIIFRYLRRINYRADRVLSWCMSLQYSGDNKHVFASLFTAINRQSPCNVEMRGHLFHAQNLIYFFYTIPFFLLISWGFSIAPNVEPQSLGISICLLGMAAVLLILGFRSWEYQKWRMSRLPLVCLALSTLLFFMYIISTVFVDPAVILYDAYFDFTALGLVFGAINTVPLILLSFQRDKAFKDSLKVLICKMAETLIKMKSDPEKPTPVLDANKIPSVSKALHGLLGSDYTLNPKVPLFTFAGVLNEIAPSKSSGMKSGQRLYRTSLVILFVYLMIAVARTEYPSLAFLNILALILLDSIHTSVSHGDNHWSPGYHIFLLVVGRLLIMGSSGHYWVLNYSLCFLVYSWALIQEIINKMLPMLTEEQAGEAVFVGVDAVDKAPNMDMAGTPQFSLGLLMYAFVSILLITAFSHPDELPVTLAEVWGAEWHLYVFGLIACCFTITGGLLSACIRAFYLEKHGLLRGWSRESFMLRKSVKLPVVLAAYTEIAIVSSGVLIYGATGSAAILTLAIFVPPIVVCFAYTYKVWVGNDYDLIVWPPVEKSSDHVDDSPTDIEKVSAKGTSLKTLGNFQLAPLRGNPSQPGGPLDDTVKMPPLPLKSALRKKRELMGIKPASQKQLVVMNEGNPEDSDTFGNTDVFLSADDPWAEYDDDDDTKDEDDDDEVAKKASGERKGFFQSDSYLKWTNAWSKSVVGKWCTEQKAALSKFKQERMKTYQPVHPQTMDDDEDEANENRDDVDPALLEEDPDQGSVGSLEESKTGDGSVTKGADGEWKPGDDLSLMPFKYAVLNGYLSSDEYLVLGTWFGGMFLVMVMGCVLGAVVNPAWLGPTVWMAIWMFVCAAVPITKYFNTYELDETTMAFIYFAVFMHFMFCICFFGAALEGDTGIHASLWLLDFFFLYPVVVYLCIELYIWVDNGFIIYLEYFKLYPLFIAMAVLFVWHLYDWISALVGNVAILLLLVVCVGYVFVRDWAANQFYLSGNLTFAGNCMINFILFITFLVSLFNSGNPIFPLSVFFFTYIFKCCTKIATRFIVSDPNTLIFFSPYVMPVFSYDPAKSDLVDETAVAKDFFQALVAGALWGAFLAMFLYPVSVGVGVACMFLLVIASLISATVSRVPLLLGRYSNLLTHDIIQAAANAAREKFEERKSPLDLSIDEEAEPVLENKTSKQAALKGLRKNSLLPEGSQARAEAETRSAKLLGLQVRNKTALDLATELLDDTRALTHMKGWVRHSESLFTPNDALAESLITGRGPIGFFGLEGLLYKLFQYAKKNPKLKFLDQPWLSVYDENANRLNASQLTEDFDTVGVLSRFSQLDDEIDDVAFEEARCGVHFLILMTLAGQSRLKREQVLVQKFFRENRFRLASNGISPPAEIFSSSSYASIDIPLVAVWLSTLSTDERERFHSLKVSFSEEQTKRDEAVDDEDYQFQVAAADIRKKQKAREIEMSTKVKKEILARQAERHNDEATDYARAILSEVESASKHCRIGEYGRNYQFVDPEFPPGDVSLGPTPARPRIQNWRCAPGINEQVRLFEDGTDPDDVDTGAFDTDWLLSAISMLAAAGGVGDGGIDEQVANLFIGHFALDGDITFHTEVGGYCVRLFKNGIWTPIVVDDMFPMLRNEYWSNDNKGIATAHSKECSEIWVALIEKAYAKYYGSYSAIEKGFVHHALSDLTGCEAESIDLANAGRGPGKIDTWDKIMRFRRNGYLLGAGTGSSALVDKEILDMGIVFNACYVIYDVRSVDGHMLLKLRNPPGNHEEWKGDWSDKSSLWTKRLKKKLEWTDEDDNTFWMSFDDFCNVYRHLYVCRWYDKKRWKTKQFPGYWKRSAKKMEEEAAAVEHTAGGLPSIQNSRCKIQDNPHFQLRINRPTDLRITLAQTDSRGVANEVIQPVTMFLLKPLAKPDFRGRLPRIEKFDKDEMVQFTGPPKREMTMHLYASLLPGEYMILPACHLSGMEGHFTLTLLSNYNVNVKQIWPA